MAHYYTSTYIYSVIWVLYGYVFILLVVIKLFKQPHMILTAFKVYMNDMTNIVITKLNYSVNEFLKIV